MSSIPITICHPTTSEPTQGDIDLDHTLRDVCVALQAAEVLPAGTPVDRYGAVLERTNATLPMNVPARQLALEPNDSLMLQTHHEGALR